MPPARSKFQSTPAFSGEGTRQSEPTTSRPKGFNPPPPFQAREHNNASGRTNGGFQSTPAFSGEGTGDIPETYQDRESFNPPPPFQAWDHANPNREFVIVNRVSIHPRHFRRGNPNPDAVRINHTLVSIHPRLFRRGNSPAASQ